MAQQQDHPTFRNIYRGNLEEVHRRVRADAAVLEEREGEYGMTQVVYAICEEQPAIALWLIEHRGQHDPDTMSMRALHHASARGPLSVVKALVGAGANPAASDQFGSTPLTWAAAKITPTW